jgi:hypothetical protein
MLSGVTIKTVVILEIDTERSQMLLFAFYSSEYTHYSKSKEEKMPRDRQSILLSSILFSSLLVLGTVADGLTKIAQSSEPAQLATKSTLVQSTGQFLASKNTATLNKIKVFFPKTPQSNNNFSYVEPVSRTTRGQITARFAIEQLIAGPTRAERQNGFTPAIELSGTSNCTSNFKLSISQGVARLQFCRTVASAGVGSDARSKSALTATLKQFSSIKSVIILDKNGNCFGDMSGENRCLSK